VHRPELAIVDAGSQMRFAAGYETGAVACALHPDGVMVEAEPDLMAAIARTRELLEGRHDQAIFEATFSHDGVLVRVDIMEPDDQGSWGVAEVKSSTGCRFALRSDPGFSSRFDPVEVMSRDAGLGSSW